MRGGSSLEVKEVARKEGMRTLIEDGWRLVREGITTPSEVMRVSKDEDAAMIEKPENENRASIISGQAATRPVVRLVGTRLRRVP